MQSEKSEHFQTCKHHFRLAILECINTRAIFVRYPVKLNKKNGNLLYFKYNNKLNATASKIKPLFISYDGNGTEKE